MNELLVRLSEGDDVVNEVITYEFDQRLPQKLARKFQTIYPNKQMDILSTALLALVRGVNSLQGQGNPQYIEPTLNRMIRNSILSFLNDDRLIPVPRGSKYDAKKRGELIIEPKVLSINISGVDDDFEISDNTYCEMMAEKELREQIDCCLNDFEQQILQARLRGSSLNEIARSRGCSPQAIGQRIKEMRKKCYAISIYSKRQDSLQRRRVFQSDEETSETLISNESVRRSCASRVLEPVSNDPNSRWA